MRTSLSITLVATLAWIASAAPGRIPGRGTEDTFKREVRFEPDRAIDTHLTSETKLVPDDGVGMDAFGSSVSVDGDTVLAGAFLHAGSGIASGAAYVFRRGDTGWLQEAKLVPDDVEPFDFFGVSVSLDGDRAVAGSFQDDDNGMESGSAYVFERTGTDWAQTAKLTASDGAMLDVFGNATALDGDLIVIGAPRVDGDSVDEGAAYVYRHDGTAWIEEARLTASDGDESDRFGTSVAVDGNLLVVGAPFDDGDSGSAYVFAWDGAGWNEQARLTASDADDGRQFGLSVSVDGETVVVGSEFAADGGVYVFGPDSGGWVELQKLTVDDGIGFAVSVAGDTLAAGAYLDDPAGAAYVFGRTAPSWTEDQKLAASDAEAGDRFGFAVSTDGSSVAVGNDLDDDNGMDAGAVYVYESDDDAQPPVADAGVDSSSECASFAGAEVRLDGSGSVDPGGGTDAIASYEWFEDFGEPTEAMLGRGEILDVTLPLGDHAITLRVTNDAGLDDMDDVTATVVDTTAPEIAVEVRPDLLWPPNHRMVTVAATITATDACGLPDVVLDSVESSEPDNAPGAGDGNTVNDIKDAEPGTADFEFRLRAERAGAGTGRTYTIRYTASDASGNADSGGAEVRVPKSLGGPKPDVAKSGRERRGRDGP